MATCKHGNTGHCDYCLAVLVAERMKDIDNALPTAEEAGRALMRVIDAVPLQVWEMLDKELERRGIK